MTYISQRLASFGGTEFQEVFRKKTSLTNPIDLSVGITEDNTPAHIKAAGIQAIAANNTSYTATNGIHVLRHSIAEKLVRENGLPANSDNVSVSPGLTTALLMIYMALLDPGDEIIIIDPYYPPYVDVANAIGARAITVPTLPTFQLDLPAIESAVTKRTRAIVINSPNNPTGAVYDEASLTALAALAGNHGITVISDEIYEYFTYEKKHFSIGSIYPNTVTMNGFSKAYAMTGWRLGYVCGPREVIDAINTLQQYIVFSSSSIAQHAGLAALRAPLDLDVEKYRHKRNVAVEKLTSAGYVINGAEGAFYLYFQTPDNMDDAQFTEKAAARNLLLIPGSAFSSGRTNMRLSYGVQMDILEKGLDILVELKRGN